MQNWRDIIKPDATISTTDESVSTGIIKIQDKLIIILQLFYHPLEKKVYILLHFKNDKNFI